MIAKPKCKITVIKRSLNQDVIDTYLKEDMKGGGLCSSLKEGDEFLVLLNLACLKIFPTGHGLILEKISLQSSTTFNIPGLSRGELRFQDAVTGSGLCFLKLKKQVNKVV